VRERRGPRPHGGPPARLFRDVIRTHQPEIERVLAGEPLDPRARPSSSPAPFRPRHVVPAVVDREQNVAMRQRRRSEVERGYDGCAARSLRSCPRPRSTDHADEMRTSSRTARTPRHYAHRRKPSASRCSKASPDLRRLGISSPALDPPERSALVENLRTEIELLWLTGELRLAKPTVEQELAWDCTSSTRTCSRSCPSWWTSSSARCSSVPGGPLRCAAVLPVRLVDGGDRTESLFTNYVTRRTLSQRIASLRRLRQALADLLRALSAHRASDADAPSSGGRSVARVLAASGDAERSGS